jgi:oligopeptide transport system substrate-binding protein
LWVTRCFSNLPGVRPRLHPLLASCLVGALLCAGGCGGREEPADLIIVNGAEPESLDPQIVSGQPEMRVVSSLFEGLTRFNARTGDPEPALASHWELSPDGLVYTFICART